MCWPEGFALPSKHNLFCLVRNAAVSLQGAAKFVLGKVRVPVS